MAYDGMPAPDEYRQAVRAGVAIEYSVDATFAGSVVATDLRPVGGSTTDTAPKTGSPASRRTMSVDFAGGHELYDLLSPAGTILTPTAKIRLTSRTSVSVPMGVFVVVSPSVSESSGKVSVTAPDKWYRIKRARFVGPMASTPGIPVTQQITRLVQGALGDDEAVVVTATSQATVGVLTWEKDRDKAIWDLADSIGAWVFFDRFGVCTIADLPTLGRSADWLVDASASGVLLDLDRSQSQDSTFNVVVVESSAGSGAAFTTQWVWDDSPDSPTYAGPDPVNRPGLAGPFGIATYYFDTPLPLDESGARAAGLTVLARTTGLAKQASMNQVPNPAMDAMDVLDLLPPGWVSVAAGSREGGFGASPFGDTPFGESPAGPPVLRRISTRGIERHIADSVTHPLSVDGSPAQQISGRSTRTDAFTS